MMKELRILIYFLRMKPVVFTTGVHQQISPAHIAWRKQRRLRFHNNINQYKKGAVEFSRMGFTVEQAAKQIKLLSRALNPFYLEYIEGLRREYNRYHACVNSPLWR